MNKLNKALYLANLLLPAAAAGTATYIVLNDNVEDATTIPGGMTRGFFIGLAAGTVGCITVGALQYGMEVMGSLPTILDTKFPK